MVVMLLPAAKQAPVPAVNSNMSQNQAPPQPKLIKRLADAVSEARAKAVIAPKTVPESPINVAAAPAQPSNIVAVQPAAEVNKSKEPVGGQAEAVYTPPQYRAAHLKNPKIEMPFISRRKNESGVVRLWVKVSAKGEPLQVRIEKSSGFSRLDDTAYQAVKNTWRFDPAKRGDTPIESEVAFNIPFVLIDAE